MQAEGDAASRAAAERALDWLLPLQLLDDPGDWRVQRPNLPGGGWAFQFANGHYPDLDDTAVIAWAMCHASDPSRYAHSLNRALDWLVGMQSRNGGFAAFDAENTHYHLNYIPFADHGALLDPPTSDVSARVVTALAVARRPQDRPAMARAMAYLRNEQCADGSWFGRWGTNYIYGTWSVLTAFAHAGIGPDDEAVQRAIGWFEARQNLDGGWGESNDSYARPAKPGEPTPSNPYQTAWALLALLAAGAGRSDAVRSGVAYLRRTQQADGLWTDPTFTAPGFPRVFYLRYHGYPKFFPLWAVARYRNLKAGNSRHVAYGL
jgi:squalene-hopene/tetraprenyl-beta-curcumene cyclase